MKNLLAIFVVALLATSLSFAANGPSTTVSASVGIHVIAPFTITPLTNISDLPDLAAGMEKVFPESSPLNRILFNMTKAADKYVRLELTLPQPVGGVTLDAYWFFADETPAGTYAFPLNPLNQNFDWYGPQTIGSISLDIKKITVDATASVGEKTFVATCKGYYINL